MRRPPTNVREKRTAQYKTRRNNYAKKYLVNLKRSFHDADVDGVGSLTEEQWKNSSIRFYLHDGNLTGKEFMDYFRRIDANCDGRVDWEELADFLILEVTCSGSTRSTDETKIVLNKIPSGDSITRNRHLEPITHFIQSNWIDKYITLSRDSIKFWQPTPLQYLKSLPAQGPFSCACVFRRNRIFVVATQTRKLMFYDLDTLEMLPIEMSGSPSAKFIKQMEVDEALSTFKCLQSKKEPMPIYNIPMRMTEACFTPNGPFECRFLIGDDCGFIEAFCLTMPQRRSGTDYKVTRFARSLVHSGPISQLEVINEWETYASSGQDGTVKFFDVKDNKVTVTRVFNDGYPVTCFTYIPNAKSIVICGNGHDPSVWSVHPPLRNLSLTGNYNAVLIASKYVTQLGDEYAISFTTKKEIRLYDSTAFVMKNEFVDNDYLMPDNQFSCTYFDSGRRFFFTCCGYPIQWVEGRIEGPKGITHQQAIVGCHWTHDFDQLITVDAGGNTATWDYNTGKMHIVRSLAISDINESVVDSTGRKLITSTFEGALDIWNPNSGGHIADIETGGETQTTNTKFFSIGDRSFLTTAGWSKVVSVYRELEPSDYHIYRSFPGHCGDISALAVDTDSGYIASGSVIGEVYAWPLDSKGVVYRTIVEDESPVEVMNVIDRYLIIGDSDGYLSIATMPHLEWALRIKAHTETVPYSVSALDVHQKTYRMLTADTLGYVRLWFIKISQQRVELDPLKIIRCHDCEITKVTMVGAAGAFFATVGTDMAVRLWGTDSMSFVGTFSVTSNWNIRDISTWEKDPPVENEEKFFAVQHNAKPQRNNETPASKVDNSLRSTRSTRSLRSTISLASALASTREAPVVNEKPETTNEKSDELDWDMIQEIMQMTMNYSRDFTPNRYIFEEPEEKWTSPEPTMLLQDDLRAQEMIARIQRLHAQTFNADAPKKPKIRVKPPTFA